MIGDLSSYRLQDFFLFSKETYLRHYELFNQHNWPMWLIFLVIFTVLTVRPKLIRVSFGFLGLVWLGVAYFFLYSHYGKINWLARYLSIPFYLGAIYLFFLMMRRDHQVKFPKVGMAIMLFALYLSPLLELLIRQGRFEVSLFAINPSPTALYTLGLGLLFWSKDKIPLAVLSILWIIIALFTSSVVNIVL